MKKKVAILVTLATVSASFALPIVNNGSFEETQTAVRTIQEGVVDGWDYSPGFEKGLMPAYEATFAFDVPADDGNQFVYLWVPGNEIAQDIGGFVIGETYQIQWSERARPGYTGNLWVLMDGVTIDAAHAVSDGAWVTGSATFTATATSHRLRFYHNGVWDTMTFVDDVTITPYTGPIGADPFPVIASPVLPNLIPNGSFDQIANKDPDDLSTPQVWNINGSYGDFIDFENRTIDVVGWTPYQIDPNGLRSLVGIPHVITGDSGDLNGTFYLDTLWTTSETIVLNTSTEYGNGLMQSNCLDGVSINPSASYEFSVEISGTTLDESLSTFTAALTAGTDATNTAAAVPNALIEISGSYAAQTATSTVLGTDLAGQINVVFNSLNTKMIPGFPTIAPGDEANDTYVSQLSCFEIAIREVFVAQAGDVNKDGVVNQGDVVLAQLYLDGNGGDSAIVRQNAVIANGSTTNETLTYLNLTDFDMNGDDYFDADDVAAIQALVPPLVLQIAPNGGMLEFEWNSQTDGPAQEYTLEATDSLTITNWTPYNDGVTTYENLPASGMGTNTLAGVLANGAVNFFRMVESEAKTTYLAVQEPSFEDYFFPNQNMNAVWNATVNGGYSVMEENFGAPDTHFPTDGAADGNYYALMREAGTISQNLVSVNAGDTLTVTFEVGRALGQYDGGAGTLTGEMTCTLKVGASSNVVTINTADFAADSWEAYTNTWVSTESGTLNIEFAYVSGFGPFLDNISSVERVKP